MKLDGATIAIEPRSVGGCVDLAVLFCRHHLKQIAGLTLLFGVPSCVLAYLAANHTDAGLLLSGLLFFVVSPFLGAALVAGAGYRVFGDPFTLYRSLRILRSRWFVTFLWIVATRVAIGLGALLCLFPGLPIAVRYGFVAELVLLEQTTWSRFESRISELARGFFPILMARAGVIAFFFASMLLSWFVMIDLTSGVLLGLPVLLGRTSSAFFVEEATHLFLHDPVTVTAFTGTMWLVYPLARLAWFFCYLDTRIRKECWDVELDFRIEARRLEAAA
jgi:hypothetical protein